LAKPRGTLYGWAYGTLMRLAHRFNWHHTRTCYPDGDTYVRCDWCGLGAVMQKRDYKPAITNEQCASMDVRHAKP
jgi:hypothetical protein